MTKSTLSKTFGMLSLAFVKLRVLQVLIVCAVLLICIRLERLYSISDDIFVNGAKAEAKPAEKKDPEPAAAADPAKKADAPAAAEKPATAEKPAATEKKAEFTADQKGKEGFKAESFDILELSAEQVEVLRTLSKRHRDLVDRERSISEREATLQAIELRLDQKTAELKKIQDYLKQLLDQKDEKEKESIKKLVVVYQKMKPAEAANILQGLDLETLLNIMDEMKDGNVSAIIAKMEPVKARVLTIELAQRRKKLEDKMQHEQEVEQEAEKAEQAPPIVPAAAPAQAVKEAAVSTDPAKPVVDPVPLDLKNEKPITPAKKPAEKPSKPKLEMAKPAPSQLDSKSLEAKK